MLKAHAILQNTPPCSQKSGEESKKTLPAGLAETLDYLHHPKFQKPELGNHLYPLVSQVQPDLAGKITGMLLEKDVDQLLEWLKNPVDLLKAVDKALLVLSCSDRHSQESQTKHIDATTLDYSDSKDNQNNDNGPPYDSKTLPYHSASLCIPNLPSTFTEAILFEHFDRLTLYADVSSIRLCRDLGCAYVHFACADDALRALIEVGADFGLDEGNVILESDF